MYPQHNPYPNGSDDFFMVEALRVAHGGLGWTSPNPAVGCVLVRDGVIIGRGFHAVDGGLHAEAEALADAGDAAGATAFVTLEPCSHEGRQPACCRLLAEAGVSRVVYGVADADPRSANQAADELAAHSIDCSGPQLERDCARMLDYYLHTKSHSSTFVHLKLALSLDARMACANGVSQWLSGPQSLGFAHYLRQKYDAIMVGAGTVLADNPRLTTRQDALANYMEFPADRLRNPARVVFDPHGLLADNDREFAVAHLTGMSVPNIPPLTVVTGAGKAGSSALYQSAEIVTVENGPGGRIELGQVMERLWNLDIGSIVIEGGVRLAREVIRQGVAHRCSLVYTPKLIGDDGQGFSPELGLGTLEDCPELDGVQQFALGVDSMVDGYFEK